MFSRTGPKSESVHHAISVCRAIVATGCRVKPGHGYVRSADDVKDDAGTIILYQFREGTRDQTLPVAHLDSCSVRPVGDGG